MRFTAVFSLLAILLTQVVAMPVLPSAVPSGTHVASVPVTAASGVPKAPVANGGTQNTGPANSGSQGTSPIGGTQGTNPIGGGTQGTNPINGGSQGIGPPRILP